MDQTRVPSIEADATAPATAIPVRGTAGGRPTKQAVPVGDESPFGPSGAGGGSLASQQGAAADPPPAPGIAGEAQANMRRYQSQLGSMLGQLQGLTDKAAGGDKASAAALASAMVLPGTNMNAAAQANPCLLYTSRCV